jgi:hypothetical protein
VTDEEGLTCQQFEWRVENREKFLRLQNDSRTDDDGKLTDDEIGVLAHKHANDSIRTMTRSFHAACHDSRVNLNQWDSEEEEVEDVVMPNTGFCGCVS